MSKWNVRARFAVAGAAVAMMTALLGGVAHADSSNVQQNKNMWRNIAIGAGALGVYGLANHNTMETLLGAAGAAYAANQYEKDRHQESVDSSYRSGDARATAERYNHRYGTKNRTYYAKNGHVYMYNRVTGRRVEVG